jgi:glutathione S-transferase
MALSDRDLEQVGNYVRAHLIEWLPVPVLELNERIVRVEEELKAQRELMQRGFDQVERRFRGQTWLIGVGFVLISTLMSLYALLG